MKIKRSIADVQRAAEAGNDPHNYIVVFKEPAVPEYRGGLTGFPPTNLEAAAKDSGIRRTKIDTKAPEVVAYRGYLRGRQDILVSDMQGKYGSMNVRRSYQMAMNGVSAVMSDSTAEMLKRDDNVRLVVRNEAVAPDTVTSVGFVGAVDVHRGEANGTPYLGEGMVVGIIDSGLNPNHPSFAATGDDGYTHVSPVGTDYLGECATDPSLCNSKLIGMYSFLDTNIANDDGDPVPGIEGQALSFDSDGHGSHVGATAAGNVVFDAVLPNADGVPGDIAFAEISGVAPHANVINYK
ncbi:MAG: S8 family serine peptidase, partial [Myxococcota bacterium]